MCVCVSQCVYMYICIHINTYMYKVHLNDFSAVHELNRPM